MNYARWLRRARTPGVAVLATAAVALAGGDAYAGACAGSGITFATQSVSASSGGGTVAIGVSVANGGTSFAGGNIFYVSNPTTVAIAAGLPFTISFTLPSGVLFTSAPGAVGDPVLIGGTAFAAAMTQSAGGIGQNFITFTGTTNAVAAGAIGVVGLGAFSANGATALATPIPVGSTAFNLKPTVSSAGAPAFNDAGGAASQCQLAASGSALAFATAGAINALAIDITPPSLGSNFTQNGVVSKVGDDGAVTITATSALVNAADTAAFTAPGTANVVLTGNWSNIAAPVLLAAAAGQAQSCPAAPSGVTGTISGSTLTFPNVTIASGANFYEVCLVSSATAGKNLIAANPAGPAVSLPASGATGPAGGAFLTAYNYNGSVQQILYSGDFSSIGYSLALRITNNTSSAAAPAVLVIPDSGTPGVANLTVPASANSIVFAGGATGLVKTSGATPDSTGRVALIFLTPGAACINNGAGPTCAVSVEQFVVNPNGTISVWGSGASP